MRIMKRVVKIVYQIIFNIFTMLIDFFPDCQWGNKTRGYILKPFFKKCGKNIQICKKVHILYPYNIEIGNDVYIGYGSWINAQCNIKFEDEVMLGPYVCIVSGNHSKRGDSYRFGTHDKKPIVIEFGSWIGAHSIILPGVYVKKGSLIAAGGVVTKSTEELSINAGVPTHMINPKIKDYYSIQDS